ncbi:MAG: hypothetical protein OEW16_13640, partial [Gammaproteobacteria bacterium]|nr:hypothetical protein [Gammaproteobacteria bacterium]
MALFMAYRGRQPDHGTVTNLAEFERDGQRKNMTNALPQAEKSRPPRGPAFRSADEFQREPRITTRRLLARPSLVSFVSTGLASP